MTNFQFNTVLARYSQEEVFLLKAIEERMCINNSQNLENVSCIHIIYTLDMQPNYKFDIIMQSINGTQFSYSSLFYSNIFS